MGSKSEELNVAKASVSDYRVQLCQMPPRIKEEEDRRVTAGSDNVKSLVTLPGRNEYEDEYVDKGQEQLLRQILQKGKQRNVVATGGKCNFHGSNSHFSQCI